MESPSTETHVLHNDKVRFTVHRKPACVVEFDVEALEPLVQIARKRATKAVSKEVVLPGFRKGRAPEALVVKNYSSQIDKQSEQEIADIAFQECNTLANIPLLHRNAKVSYKMKSCSATGALLTLVFETEPSIPQVDPKTFQLAPVKRPEVSEKKVQETIRQIQLFFAEWHAVTDRPIQEGDFVLLNVDIIEEDPPKPLFSRTRFEVTETSMAQWMRTLVLGKNCRDTVEGVSIPDADASDEEKETLKPKKVRLFIEAVDTATLPSIDEALLKQLGVSSLEELTTNVTQLLNTQADAHVQEAQREQVSAFLLNHYSFDLPRTLIEQETQFRIQQLMNDQEFKTYWDKASSEEKIKSIRTIHEQSEKAVRMFYLCRNIIETAKIPITPNDLPPPANHPLELLLTPQKFFHHQRTPEAEHAEAFSRLMLEKAEDYLIAAASANTPAVT